MVQHDASDFMTLRCRDCGHCRDLPRKAALKLRDRLKLAEGIALEAALRDVIERFSCQQCGARNAEIVDPIDAEASSEPCPPST